MRQADAKTAIEFEWRDWPEKAPAPTPGDMRAFYGWLEVHRPYLLEFRTKENRYDVIRRWLEGAHAIGAGP